MQLETDSSRLMASAAPGGAEEAPTLSDVLRLISSGPNGTILLTLSNGSLRSSRLTLGLRCCAPRTVYRSVARLADLSLVERRQGLNVPSEVVYGLTYPTGRSLCQLLSAFAAAWWSSSTAGPLEGEWTVLALLAEMWEFGLFEHLNGASRSLTELAGAPHGLTFHQIKRRTHLLHANGLIRVTGVEGGRRRYALTEQARRGMALILGIGRWAQTAGAASGCERLTVPQLLIALRTVAPLIQLPEHQGKQILLEVRDSQMKSSEIGARLLVRFGKGGAARCVHPADGEANAMAAGTAGTWYSALLDGNRGRVRASGELSLVDSCLIAMHQALWNVNRRRPR